MSDELARRVATAAVAVAVVFVIAGFLSVNRRATDPVGAADTKCQEQAHGVERPYHECIDRATADGPFAGSGPLFAVAGGGIVVALVAVATKRER
jgi:hypothetical protein